MKNAESKIDFSQPLEIFNISSGVAFPFELVTANGKGLFPIFGYSVDASPLPYCFMADGSSNGWPKLILRNAEKKPFECWVNVYPNDISYPNGINFAHPSLESAYRSASKNVLRTAVHMREVME